MAGESKNKGEKSNKQNEKAGSGPDFFLRTIQVAFSRFFIAVPGSSQAHYTNGAGGCDYRKSRLLEVVRPEGDVAPRASS